MLELHLDTDIGGDIDDLCALAMVLNWPEVELLAVTTNCDDRGRRGGVTRYALGLAGRGNVAVAAGADIPLDRYRVRPGMHDQARYWPEPILLAPTPIDQALRLLERSIERGAFIAAISAFTNLARLERRSPGILSRAKLFLMTGHVFPVREGFPPWGYQMDWNNQIDVRSAHFVLQRSNPTLIPLSVSVETSLRRACLPRLKQAGPLAQIIARQTEAWAEDEGIEARYGQTCSGLPDDTINFLHDPLACAIALGWNDGVEISEIRLKSEIEDGWLRQSVDASSKPTRIVTGIDGNKFGELWLGRVTRDHVPAGGAGE